MRRRARASPLTRVRPAPPFRKLRNTAESEWPATLQSAWKILHDEIGVSKPIPRTIIGDAALVAHRCAQKINDRVRNNEHHRLAAKLGRGFARLSACIRRAPAELRKRLDIQIHSLLVSGVIDSEVVEEILDAAVVCFQRYPRHESAKTALATMLVASADGVNVNLLKVDYSSIDYDSRTRCEQALHAVADATVTAAAIFEALASALMVAPPVDVSYEANDLIIEYVSTVAMSWHRAGLRPSRARHPADPRYRSRFHRFVELVLTAAVDPWTQRHDLNFDDLNRRTQKVHAALPQALRGVVSAAPRRGDIEWLVTDDQVKKGLAAFKNQALIHRKR